MDTLQAEVNTALVATGYTISYHYPQGGIVTPMVTYYESANDVNTRADGAEALTNVAYVVDIWADTPEATATMALAIDTRLSALGLSRVFSIDLYEQDTSIHHKSMRYRGVIHIAEQKVYQ